MNQVATKDFLHESITPARGLGCESQLRVAASLLSRAHTDEISATTVVGVLGRDDADAFRALIAQIGDELAVDACVRLHGGSFSVRFTRRPRVPEAASPDGGFRATLRRLISSRSHGNV